MKKSSLFLSVASEPAALRQAPLGTLLEHPGVALGRVIFLFRLNMPRKLKPYGWSINSFSGEVMAADMKEAMVKSMQGYVKSAPYVTGSICYAEIIVKLKKEK